MKKVTINDVEFGIFETDEELKQAEIDWVGYDPDDPEEQFKAQEDFRKMEEEVQFINDIKIKTTLYNGTIFETEYKQLNNIN